MAECNNYVDFSLQGVYVFEEVFACEIELVALAPLIYFFVVIIDGIYGRFYQSNSTVSVCISCVVASRRSTQLN